MTSPLFALEVCLNAYYSDILEYIYLLKHEISCLTFIEHNQCKCILMYSGLIAKNYRVKIAKKYGANGSFGSLVSKQHHAPYVRGQFSFHHFSFLHLSY